MKFKVFLTIFFFKLRAFAGVESCEQSFAKHQDDTDDFISYIDHLFVSGDFSQEKMIAWLRGIERGHVVNPISKRSSMVEGIIAIHYEAFHKLISSDLNREKLRIWVVQKLGQILAESNERIAVVKSTITEAIPMKFYPIEPAEFEVDMMDKKVWEVRATTLRFDHRFEMMDAPVTQYEFATVEAYNPSKFRNGIGSSVIIVSGKEIEILPDHPVENLDWFQAINFANRLSEKAGLKPAYIYDETLQIYVADAPGNDILLTEGYRLPTAVEYFYIQTHGGTRRNPFGSEVDALQCAYLRENSNQQTHAIKELAPIFAQGMPF